MIDVERILVPEFLPGDYCTRYRGPDLPGHAIRTGDVLVTDDTATPAPGRLVIVTDPDGNVRLLVMEAGMDALGLVVGVMRRIDA